MRKFRETQYLEQSRASQNAPMDVTADPDGFFDGDLDGAPDQTLKPAAEGEQFQSTFEEQERAKRRSEREERLQKQEAKTGKVGQLGPKNPMTREIQRIERWQEEEDQRKKTI